VPCLRCLATSHDRRHATTASEAVPMAAETAGTAMETTEAPAAAAMADVVGWYSLQWKGGAFEICF